MFLITNPCETSTVLKVIYFILEIGKIVFFILPIALIVITTIDLAKNVVTSDEEKMKQNTNLTIKRFIICIIVFLVPSIVKISFDILETNDLAPNYTICFTNANLKNIKDIEEEEEVIKLQEESDKLYSNNYVFKDPPRNRTIVEINKSNNNEDDKENDTKTEDEEISMNVSANAQGFLEAADKMSKQVERDYKKNKKWQYSNGLHDNGPVSGSFEKAIKKNQRRTNCAKYVSWVLIEVGILKSGQSFYKDTGNNIVYRKGDTKKRMKEKLQYINGKNKSAKKLAEEGKLIAGDIVLWNMRHTNIYAGDGKFYDAGHYPSMNGCDKNKGEYFKTFGPGKNGGLWNGHKKVWQILRIK